MVMSQIDRITRCIRLLEAGEGPSRTTRSASSGNFFADLTSHAQRRLQAVNASRGSADEEDAAARSPRSAAASSAAS